MVELGEVNEESEEMEIPRENNIHEQKVVVAGKSMEDAENSAIKLLAKRLEYSNSNSWMCWIEIVFWFRLMYLRYEKCVHFCNS